MQTANAFSQSEHNTFGAHVLHAVFQPAIVARTLGLVTTRGWRPQRNWSRVAHNPKTMMVDCAAGWVDWRCALKRRHLAAHLKVYAAKPIQAFPITRSLIRIASRHTSFVCGRVCVLPGVKSTRKLIAWCVCRCCEVAMFAYVNCEACEFLIWSLKLQKLLLREMFNVKFQHGLWISLIIYVCISNIFNFQLLFSISTIHSYIYLFFIIEHICY